MTQEQIGIKITSEYERFKLLGGNRRISQAHVQKLVNSMRNKDLFVPIAVSPQMEVVDGQHRLEARKRLGLPVPYYVIENATLSDVQVINQQQKKWSINDYTASHIQLGNKEYEVYKWFREKYRFAHTESLQMLCDEWTRKEIHEAFNLGLFRVRDLEKAKNIAEQILKIEPFYKGVRRRAFVNAIFRLLKKKQFEMKQFLAKLELQSHRMVDCTTADMYISLIEEIYNYRSQNKVSLKYGD